MAFGQLTHRESLNDTILCLGLNLVKLYHLSIGQQITKSTLSKANENRNWRIYRDLARVLINKAQELYADVSQLDITLKQNIFALDAPIIDLCLSINP